MSTGCCTPTEWYQWTSSDPYIAHECSGAVLLVIPPCKVIRFTYNETTQSYENDSGYALMVQDDTYIVLPPDGSEPFAFVDENLYSGPTANGNTMQAFDPADADNPDADPYTDASNLKGLKSTSTTGGVTTTTAYAFTYDDNDRLSSSTLQTRVGDGDWETLERGVFSYSSPLSTVTQQFYENGQWRGDRVSYYRYDDEDRVKYVLEPEQFELLSADPEVADPLQASDEKIAEYASKAFTYDAGGRIATKVFFGEDYSTTVHEDGDVDSSDYNVYAHKTTETRADGGVRIAYKNFRDQPILTEFKESASATDSTLEYYSYDASGNVLQHATSAALQSYSVSGYSITPQYRAVDGLYNVGLIYLYEYYSETTTATGGVAVKGYKKCDKIKKGRDGTAIKLRQYEYTQHSPTIVVSFPTVGGSAGTSSSSSSSRLAEVTTYPILREIRYRNEDGTGESVTSYAYTWYPDSLQMLERTTTLPAVPTDQNGSGVAATRVERFDTQGRVAWLKDERGVITYSEYDGAGNVIQTIQDVADAQIATPAGWSTPAGCGLHLVTDHDYDAYGRQIQTLGPAHEVDIGGTAATVRTASWTVYKDADRETWSAQGYYVPATDTYTLVNPVSISKRNASGTRSESIQAVRTSTAGKLTADDTFAQSSYVRWSVSLSNTAGQLTSTRVYHAIPATGDGVSGTNYNETLYDYDALGRQNRQETPGGTITRTVHNELDQPIAIYVGTDDTGATDDDPTGQATGSSSSTAGGNNMVLITEYEYAGPAGCSGCSGCGGAGKLTATIQHVGRSPLPSGEGQGEGDSTRTTELMYDWRNRQEFVLSDADDQGRYVYSRSEYDNLDQAIRSERYHDVSGDGPDPDGGTHPDDILISRSEIDYDDRGRTYTTRTYAVDPTTGTVGNYLEGNTWYDAAGNPIKQQAAGSQQCTKTVYDGLGRSVKQYVGFDVDETAYAGAGSVTDDTILEQTETTFDAAGSVVFVTYRRRFHDATGEGELTSPSGSQPKARASYVAYYQDAVGRSLATANYGTNGGTAPTRSATVPQPSDDILVTSTEYDNTGMAYRSIDPAGKETRSVFDAAGRQTKVIQNYVDGVVSASDLDEDVTVETTYSADGQMLTLTAVNPTTGNQTTQYVYGTTLSDSAVARADLLRAEIYPDSDDAADPLGNGSDGTYDRVEYAYNRQGERIAKQDQNGTVHEYEFDPLGRLIHDRVTTVGSGIDDAVRRISTTYEVRGMVAQITSYDAASGGSAVNQVLRAYDTLGRLTTEHQEHSGAKDASSLYVETHYADFATYGLRSDWVRYPNGRKVHFGYSSTAGSALNRLDAILDDNGGLPGNTLAEYSYLGLGTMVVEDFVEPDVKLDHFGGTSGVYAGFDRFGRVVQQLWYDYGASADRDNFTYGYDRAGNRLYREHALASLKDEHYQYDGVNQLTVSQRGDLNAGKTAISGTPVREEDFGLDALGNWTGYVQKTSGSTDLDQSRVHNQANELTSASPWATPVHDRAGNMTAVPKPSSLTSGLTLEYDAWNRLVQVTDGERAVGRYEYDGGGRRIKRHIDSQSPSSPDGIDRYEHLFYLGVQLVETRHTTTVSDQPESLQPKYQFIWSPRYIDAPILRDENTDSDSLCDDARIYYLTDANMNVTSLVDTSGDALERYVYASYGRPTMYIPDWSSPRSSSSYNNSVLYTGRHLDAESGLYYYRARYYQPDLGRFVSRDPMGYDAVPSLYQYVRATPPNGVDPDGLIPRVVIIGIGNYHVDRTFELLPTLQCKCGQTSEASVTFGLNLGLQFGALANLLREKVEASLGISIEGTYNTSYNLQCQESDTVGTRIYEKQAVFKVSFDVAWVKYDWYDPVPWPRLWSTAWTERTIYNFQIVWSERTINDNGGSCCKK